MLHATCIVNTRKHVQSCLLTYTRKFICIFYIMLHAYMIVAHTAVNNCFDNVSLATSCCIA